MNDGLLNTLLTWRKTIYFHGVTAGPGKQPRCPEHPGDWEDQGWRTWSGTKRAPPRLTGENPAPPHGGGCGGLPQTAAPGPRPFTQLTPKNRLQGPENYQLTGHLSPERACPEHSHHQVVAWGGGSLGGDQSQLTGSPEQSQELPTPSSTRGHWEKTAARQMGNCRTLDLRRPAPRSRRSEWLQSFRFRQCRSFLGHVQQDSCWWCVRGTGFCERSSAGTRPWHWH